MHFLYQKTDHSTQKKLLFSYIIEKSVYEPSTSNHTMNAGVTLTT